MRNTNQMKGKSNVKKSYLLCRLDTEIAIREKLSLLTDQEWNRKRSIEN